MKKTYGVKEAGEKVGLSKQRIRAICNTMSEADKTRLGIYESNGYQIPKAALKDDLFKRKRRKKS